MTNKRGRDEQEFEVHANTLVHNPANASRMKRKEPLADWDGDVQALAVLAKDCILTVLAATPEKQAS